LNIPEFLIPSAKYKEVILMKKHSCFRFIITIVTIAVTIGAAVASFVVIFERKRRDEEELERYLDGAIQ
jgi:preprotein translocase subunit SecD